MVGAFDEVYDATWLTLEAAGWAVGESDPRAGTFVTQVVVLPDGLGRGWAASVSQEGGAIRVTLLPRVYRGSADVTPDSGWLLDGPGGEVERWDALFAGIGGLISAWREAPELALSNARGELNAAGMRLLIPNWQHFEFSLDRRTLVMQPVGPGPASTLLYRIERRRPKPDAAALVHETLEHAFHASGRLAEPASWDIAQDAWGETAAGDVLLDSDSSPNPVRWRRWEAGNSAWVVRVAAACPAEKEPRCEGEVRRVIESAVNTAPVPGIRAR